MPLSETQKLAARRELRRRREVNTAATYRMSFFKAAGLCIASLLVLDMGWSTARHGVGWMIRGSGMLMCVMGLGGLLVSGSLAYVRGLDWRRATRTEAET